MPELLRGTGESLGVFYSQTGMNPVIMRCDGNSALLKSSLKHSY